MGFFKNLFRRTPKVEKIDVAKRFELMNRIGQGSMSKVWKARDPAGKIVAIKILDRVKTKKLEARFVGLNKPTEGEIAIKLDHPHIVKTYECGITTNDEQFLVMEYIDGVSLSYLIDAQNDAMKKNRLRFAIELGEAIAYFHKQNLIHRDLCPHNVLLDRDYSIKLIDFGLVVPNTAEFRKPGNRTGTATYMAPELMKRQKTDQRIDIFSFAITCYKMFTKRMPWDSVDTLEMMKQRMNTPPEPITTFVPDIDPRLAEIIMRGVESDPSKRWSTMSGMVQALREVHDEIEYEVI
ncbi:MAG: serine/threonine-protein kinase [Planctomycetota bacterium]|nr:serine/threonine-protein kinase [Planctomycetota bacterium]MDA1213078.1 serine/threonine-protein kinase [Planctomycetota bacterium]